MRPRRKTPMATTPLPPDPRPATASDEIRGAALVAHIEATLAAYEAAKRVSPTPSTPDA
jgi:hypothetical protein